MSSRHRLSNPYLVQPFTALALLLAFSLGACGETKSDDPSLENSSEIPSPSTPDGASAPDPALEFVDSSGWKELIVTSDYAEIKFDPSGHWTISRNNCWVAGYGALTLQEWNSLARPLNQLLRPETGRLTDELCFPEGEGTKALSGTVELMPANGPKVTVLSQRYPSEICTLWNERSAAISLRKALDQILPRAFAEDCTLPGQ